MNSLKELKKTILAGGVIGKEDVNQIRILLSDGSISRENANILFEIKDACTSKNNDAGWEKFFINAITSYLLDDDTSPGHIDDDEAQWLRAKIQHDGKLTKTDRALLLNLKRKSVNFPEILHYKSMHVLFFEAVLYSSRFVTFLAVLGSLTASVVLFILSTIRVINGLIFAVDSIKSLNPQNIDQVIAIFVSSIDGYLFSTVLLIFGMGIYELFINKIDIVSKGKDTR
ncbi:MAG: YqhA family protein, partial [Prevotellaceae bacterium]|nr:YqhA family protein [Prevotellaceae bacterium]